MATEGWEGERWLAVPVTHIGPERCIPLGSSPRVQSRRREGRRHQKEQHGDHMDGKGPFPAHLSMDPLAWP